ncbi:Ejaculatory bulb-specific protein 3 [Anthophora plagiata]
MRVSVRSTGKLNIFLMFQQNKGEGGVVARLPGGVQPVSLPFLHIQTAMKASVICLLLLVAVAYVAARPEEDKYTNKFDNVNVDQILHSDRLLTNYYKCLMDEGRCTAEGNELKKVLPDALATECKKCSDKQREVIRKVIKYLVDNKPELWTNLANKYDPEKKYRMKFEEEAKKIGVKV